MLEKIMNEQYRQPTGLLGYYVGNRMARDHHPENQWTVSMLEARPTDQILEVGFGSGVAIRALTEVVTQGLIAGVDYSQTMVKAAQRRNATAVRTGRVDLRCADATDLPFEHSTFDKVFSIHSIYFWPFPQLAIAEIYRVLKPGGLCVFTILPKDKWNADNSDAAVGTPTCRPYLGAELEQMLAGTGFRHTEIRADSNPLNRSNYSVIGVK